MWPRDHQRAAQALDRYLQGVRVSAIAASFHISASTVRRWINAQLSQIAREENTARVEQLQAAIETQRATAREAWSAYYREQVRLESLASEDALHRPYIHAHTYLRLALIAQREVARLQGLYTHTEPPPSQIKFVITERPAGPENAPPSQSQPAAPSYQLPHPDGRSPHDPLSPVPFPCEGKVAHRPDGVPFTASQIAQIAQTAQTAQTPKSPGAPRRVLRLIRRTRKKLLTARIRRAPSVARAGPGPPI